jgi:AcrR family transcriptional regulator
MKLAKLPGRPRSFDADQALQRALTVFWRKGYEGASLTDLTRAMRINRPSLYAAFGNKEELFRKVLARYLTGLEGAFREALTQPTARGVVAHLLENMFEAAGEAKNPRGCLIVKSAATCGDASSALRDEMLARRAAGFTALRARFQRARTEGDLPADASPADLARYVSTISYGLALESAHGATTAELRKTIDLILKLWPSR